MTTAPRLNGVTVSINNNEDYGYECHSHEKAAEIVAESIRLASANGNAVTAVHYDYAEVS